MDIVNSKGLHKHIESTKGVGLSTMYLRVQLEEVAIQAKKKGKKKGFRVTQ